MAREPALPISQINQVIYDVVKQVRIGVGRAQEFGGPLIMPEFLDFQINGQVTADGLTRIEVTTRTPNTTETRTETPGVITTRVAAPTEDIANVDGTVDTTEQTQSQTAGGINKTIVTRDFEENN